MCKHRILLYMIGVANQNGKFSFQNDIRARLGTDVAKMELCVPFDLPVG